MEDSCVSSIIIRKPRIKRVVRAIIVGLNQRSDPEYLLFQRTKQARRYPRVWECIGGSLKPEADQKAIHGLLRECSEEAGIKVSRIIREVHNERREWEAFPDDGEKFDEYHVTHYLVDTPTIRDIQLSSEHSGHGWFPGIQVGIMRPVVRNSSYDAIRAAHGLDLNNLLHVNPRHK